MQAVIDAKDKIKNFRSVNGSLVEDVVVEAGGEDVVEAVIPGVGMDPTPMVSLHPAKPAKTDTTTLYLIIFGAT